VKVIMAKDSAFIPTLNAYVPQDNGTYEANEKQDLLTSQVLFFMGKDGDFPLRPSQSYKLKRKDTIMTHT
jgi:hypothetical protein